jgi:hypothetical protein
VAGVEEARDDERLTSPASDAHQRRRRLVAVAVGLVVMLLAATGGWLVGRNAGDGQRVTTLAEAIALANAGELPSGAPTERAPRSTTAPARPGDTQPIITRAVVTENGADSGSGTVVLSTRLGELTLRSDQVVEVAGFHELPGGVAQVPVGAHVLLFQFTFGPGARAAHDYKIAVLPPGFGG